MLAASVALLRARACFELADFPCAERELRSALSLEVLPARAMDQVEEELAKALSAQNLDEEALRTIDRVIARNDTISARRVAAGLALRAQDFAAARRHADALLRLADSGRSAPNERVDGGDTSSVRAYARFVRGIARAREGELEEAIGDLEAGLELSDAERDARFELALAHSKLGRASRALAHLWEILIVDPYDEEATYRASRALIERGGADAARLAAHAARAFDALREASDPSSREEHLRAAGRSVEADLLRPKERAAMGDLEGAVRALDRAERRGRNRESVLVARAELLLRSGAFAEAERLVREAQAIVRDGDGEAKLDMLLAHARRLRDETQALATSRPSPFAEACVRLAEAEEAELIAALEAVVGARESPGDDARVIRAAGLLLALDPRSETALAFLIGRADRPDRIFFRAHYLARLRALRPEDVRVGDQLETLRRVVVGGAEE